MSGRNPTWRHQRQPLAHFVGLKCYRGRLEAHRGFRSPANPKPRRAERNGGSCRHPRRRSVMAPPRPLHASSSFPLPRRHSTPSPSTTAGYVSTCDRLPLAMAPGPGGDVRSETVRNPRDHLPLAPNADAVALPTAAGYYPLGVWSSA